MLTRKEIVAVLIDRIHCDSLKELRSMIASLNRNTKLPAHLRPLKVAAIRELQSRKAA